MAPTPNDPPRFVVVQKWDPRNVTPRRWEIDDNTKALSALLGRAIATGMTLEDATYIAEVLNLHENAPTT